MLTSCVYLSSAGVDSVGWSGPPPRTRTGCLPGDREELAVLVRQAGLFEAPAGWPSPEEPEPDRFTYAVTVEDEGQRRKARFSERSLPGRSGTSSPGSAG